MSLVFAACHDDPTFDGNLIIGKWVSGTEFYRFDADSTGVTWDTGDDVQEEEGQPFTWSFDESNSQLTLIHQMEMGGVVPKTYTITALDSKVMKFRDKYGNVSEYTRVN